MTQNQKVSIKLIAAGGSPQFNPNSVKLNQSNTFSQIFSFIKKNIRLDLSESLFLFYKEFAIYPDTKISDILEHNNSIESIDIHYSTSPAFG